MVIPTDEVHGRTTYLPARILGIQPWERRGLIAFTKAELPHQPTPRSFGMVPPPDADKPFHERKILFNLAKTGAAYECGTVCCIGGFVYIHEKRPLLHNNDVTEVADYVWQGRSSVLRDLYFPRQEGLYYYRSIDYNRARAVVVHFLRTGEIDWTKGAP